MLDITVEIDRNKVQIPTVKVCIARIVLDVMANKEALVYKGQGEGDTKWKGCAWKVLLFKLSIPILIKFIIKRFELKYQQKPIKTMK